MKSQVMLRPMEQIDMCDVLEASDGILTEEEVLRIVRQRRSDDKGTFETKVLVIEMPVEYEESGQSIEVPWTAGALFVELRPEEFFILHLVVNPILPEQTELIRAALDYLKERMSESHRKRLVYYLKDEDSLVRRQLPALKAFGCEIGLAPDYFGDVDGWRCTFGPLV